MRTIEIVFTQEGAIAGNLIMHRLFTEGWETLTPLRYFGCCECYRTTLYLPS